MQHSLSVPLTARRRFKWRGAAGILIVTPAAIIAALAYPLVAPDSWLDVTFDALAWVTFITGAGLRFWATLHIGGRKNDEVVADGPYSICRHPLYVGSALLFLSGALFLKSLVFAGAIGVLAILYFGLTVPAEEEALAARLGLPFAQYCRRVNRVWPSRGRLLTPRTITVDIHSLYLETARASRWVWLPLFGEIISHLRRMPWWPRLFHIL